MRIVGERAATSLALVIHELATNSLKYGALSAEQSLLDISGSAVEDDVEILWSEQGGATGVANTTTKGYGSKLFQLTVSGHLGGTIAHDWTPVGSSSP